MGSRKIIFSPGEFYHIYNRGVDKRNIFLDELDMTRFLHSLSVFNNLEPIGSIYEHSFLKDNKRKEKPIVHLVCYALNPNHFHLLVKQGTEKGIEKFMQRLGTSFTKYFNNKYRRSGSLFQDKFGAKHINSNEYLLHLSAYINLNDRAHQLGSKASKLIKTSWEEYCNPNKTDSRCHSSEILDQFTSKTAYQHFAHDALEIILENKKFAKENFEDTLDPEILL